MDSVRSLLSRCAAIFGRRQLDQDLDEELRAHVDLAIEENLKRGMPTEQARTAALREFGGITQIQEQYRIQRGLPFLETLAHDIRFGFRQLRKSPGFTSTAVLTLALGTGATAAMFSVVDAVVLRPLPYNNADRIVSIRPYSASGYWQTTSWPGYLETRKLNESLHSLAGYAPYWGMTLKTDSQTQYVHVTQGTDNFFDVFGVQPLLGRTFLPGEDNPGKNNIVVLSYEIWRQTFNADPHIVDKVVNLDGSPYVVIGVMPAGFRFPLTEPNLVYIPMHVRPNWVDSWQDHWLQMIGRLKPETSILQAQANMAHVMQEIGEQQPTWDKGRTVRLLPISTALHGDNELPEVWVMLGAVLAVLLVACVNVAGLLMARGVAREREMALRVAIGAARGRLIRQLLVENALLGIFGTAAGLLLATGLLVIMKAFLAHAFMRGANIHLNLTVITATIAAGLFSSVGAGLIPAWRAAKSDPNHALKSGISTGTTQHQHRLRAGFVVTQIALSLVLVLFSGLLLLTLRRMSQTDFGFNPKNLLILGVNIPAGDYKGRDFVQELMTPLEERTQAIPGVRATGFIDQPPVLGYGSDTTMQLVGHPPDPPDRERLVESRTLTPGYYAALGLPVLQGRNFSAQDTPDSQPAVIVNEAWVKEFLTPKQDPLVQTFRATPSNIAIAGVVPDVRQNLSEPARPQIDSSFSQLSQKTQQNIGSLSVCLFIRTSVPPLSIIPQLRNALHDVAPTIAFQTPSTMEDFLDDALVTNRMESWLFGIFAGIAVLLAVVGIHGLLMQEVTSRTRDIGVRMALGATRAGIAQMILTRISVLLGIGLGAGILISLLLRRVVASVVTMQYGRDGLVIAALIALLAVIGLLAALAPTRRATSIDPIQALRTE
jgi:putative ABC transport system permease protein